MYRAWIFLILLEEGFGLAQRSQDGPCNNITKTHHNDGEPPPNTEQCGMWTRNINGGLFTSPNYPETYPPNKECVYILEALPRQRIQLTFDKNYYIEPSFECRFDHIEVRDGPFGFSPLIDRFCGPKSPGTVTSTGRFMWIKFTSDEELEGLGFRIRYTFVADPDFHLHVGGLLNPIPDCQFQVGGSDGVVRSSQVDEDKIKTDEDLDCIWTIRAPPQSKIYLRFLEYQMEHSNECKKNFVAVYDGSSAIENLKAKFCSTVANDVMLDTGVGVVRMWADRNSRLSRFRMLFTSFVDPPCSGNTFFCHSNMCINNSLVCNGVQNCVYPWDENHCKERKSKGLFHQITKTHGTVIGISTGVVLVLLIISILVQMKQPRKKVVVRRPAVFNKAGFQEVFDPPHYELFSLRDKELSSDLAELSDELEGYHKLRRSSTVSRCVHEHHCGSQHVPHASVGTTSAASAASSAGGSMKQSRTTLSSMELSYHNDFSKPPPPMKTFNSCSSSGSMGTYKKSCYGYAKQTHDCAAAAAVAEQVIEDRVMEEIPCEIYVRGGSVAGTAGSISSGCGTLSIRNHGSVRNSASVVDPGQRSMSMDF